MNDIKNEYSNKVIIRCKIYLKNALADTRESVI